MICLSLLKTKLLWQKKLFNTDDQATILMVLGTLPAKEALLFRETTKMDIESLLGLVQHYSFQKNMTVPIASTSNTDSSALNPSASASIHPSASAFNPSTSNFLNPSTSASDVNHSNNSTHSILIDNSKENQALVGIILREINNAMKSETFTSQLEALISKVCSDLV